MAELPDLTFAYLQQRPESAARALEGLAAADAAEILRRVPARVSAPVVAAMSAVSAARCATELPVHAAAALCAELPWSDAAALLRRIEAKAREAMLAELPGAMARRLRRSLDYADDVVGAWIDREVPVVMDDRDAGEVLQLLTQSPAHSAGYILLTDAAQRYAGMVSLGEILGSVSTKPLSALARSDVLPLHDSASLASVIGNPGWDVTTMLPVISHRGVLQGGLDRRTLQRALSRPRSMPGDERGSLTAEMLAAYLRSGEGLLRLLLPGTVRESHRDNEDRR